MFITTLFATAKIQKQCKCSSVDEWIDYGVYLQWHTTWPEKKNEILPFVAT